MPAVAAGVEPSLAAELELAAVPHEELVRRLYRLCLRREPEPDALQHAVTKLIGGHAVTCLVDPRRRHER